MAAKSLTLNEMAQVTGVLTDRSSSACKAIQASPILGPLLAVLDPAHQAVLEALPDPEDPRLRALMAEAAQVDAVHDRLVSNVFGLLTTLAGLDGDGGSYLRLRDALFPDGVAGATQITYEGQAGFARRFRTRLTDSLRAELAGIRAGKVNLFDVVNESLDAADRLGVIGQEQQKLEAEAKPATPGAVQAARFNWIRAINGLRGVAPVADLTEEQHHAIFGTLDDVEAKADRRAASRRASRLGDPIESEDTADGVAADRDRANDDTNLAVSA
jgi:hypothetical protein